MTVLGTWLWAHSEHAWLDAFRIVALNVTSIVTTTGAALGDYTLCSFAVAVLLPDLSSAAALRAPSPGGLKIFRFQVAYVLLKANLQQLIQSAP